MPPFLDVVERMILVRDGYDSLDRRQSRRAAMILALDRGVPVASVARAVRMSRATVYRWLRLYMQYRDPGILAGLESKLDRALRCDHLARALNEMIPPPRPRHRLGRLPLDRRGRARLKREAETAVDPRARLDAAVVRAVDRGNAVSRVARVASLTRQAVYQKWRGAGGGRNQDDLIQS